MRRPNTLEIIGVCLTAVLLAFNAYVLSKANPLSPRPDGLAWDFSAFYEAGWRFIHAPGQLYSNLGVPLAYGVAQTFRYPPWFVLFILPFEALNYATAIYAFDYVSYLLLPLIAILIWKILNPKTWKGLTAVSVTLIFTLAEPLYTRYGTVTYDLTKSFSLAHPTITYLSEYNGAQSKVLQLALIFISLYMISRVHPKWGSFFLVLSAFDPRFTLLALPLFLYMNWREKSVGRMAKGLLISSVVILLPFQLYFGTLQQYILFPQYDITTIWTYEWIPFYAIVSLSLSYVFIELTERHKA